MLPWKNKTKQKGICRFWLLDSKCI